MASVGSKKHARYEAENGISHSLYTHNHNEPGVGGYLINVNKYDFYASLDELAIFPDLTPFFATHEIEHANLAQSALYGAINSRSSRKVIGRFSNYCTDHIDSINTNYRGAKATMPNNLFGAVGKMGLSFYQKLEKLPYTIVRFATDVLRYGLSRYEEKHCDLVALRAFPKMSMARYKEYLKTYEQECDVPKNFDVFSIKPDGTFPAAPPEKPKSARQAIAALWKSTTKSLFDTHPKHETRIAYLEKYQRKLQAKNDGGM